MTLSEKARSIRDAIPSEGLFAGKSWRIAPEPLRIYKDLYEQIVQLGPRLHIFNKACNFLYRQSVAGKQPGWIHRYLDAGKPKELIELSRHPGFKNDLPCVIRPDLLVTDEGFIVSELDSVPGGIGLTAWLQDVYRPISNFEPAVSSPPAMLEGFLRGLRSEILKSEVPHVAIVVSKEAKDYRPEMEWIAKQSLKLEMRSSEFIQSTNSRNQHPGSEIDAIKLSVCSPEELEYREEGVLLRGERVVLIYRFFELFDLPNLPHIEKMIAAAREGLVKVTPPFKPFLEEKLWFALFWFPQLADFWRRELGDRYFRDLKKHIPYTWLLDPAPLPPHAVIQDLQIQNWGQLASFSQKQRDLILKISGFSERAWGSRGVYLGSDMPSEEWKKVVRQAIQEFDKHPHILQRFAKTRLIEHEWYDFENEKSVVMKGRLRLCPYFFVVNHQPQFSGILATLCPSDKKLIHGMQDAIMTLAVEEKG